MEFKEAIFGIILALSLSTTYLYAQAPTGDIVGTVKDQSGGVVQEATINATNRTTGMIRASTTEEDGTYRITVLPAGEYELSAQAEGFKEVVRTVIVRVGSTTTVNIEVPVGILQQDIEAVGAFPEISFESYSIDGVISRFDIENLPLNGREFLQLSVLEPGVTAAPMAGFLTRQFDVSVLGGSPEDTRVTMDGGPIHNALNGGTPQSFSQEVVREFQLSSANLDLSTGLTASGAINVITRSGGNDYHGTGFFFFRDHNLAAYPALERDPTNPDPFFARRQTGFSLGGPIQRDRLFFFTSLEHNNQDGVVSVQPTTPEFSKFGGVFPNPFDSTQAGVRLDWLPTDRHSIFFRYSHDENDGFSPPTGEGRLPSNWAETSNWADQAVASLITSLSSDLVNEFRFSYWYWQTRNLPPSGSSCPAPCPGLGMPEIGILGTDFTIGNYPLLPEGGDFRRYHTFDNVAWHVGDHQFNFGLDWQYDRGAGFSAFLEPASMLLYSPEIVQLYNANPRIPPPARIPLPTSFDTVEDILKLPLVGFSSGIGNPSLPPPFRFKEARDNHIWRFYFQDRWKLWPRFTLSYGISYSYQTDSANHDLSKPAYLAPLLGREGLKPTRQDLNNFAPALGFAWSISEDDRTVLRAGFGIYYEQPLALNRLLERSTIGPRGSGRFIIDGSFIPNPIPGIPGVPLGQPLSFPSGPTQFTGAHLLSTLSPLRSQLQQLLGDPDNTDLSVRNIEVFKQGSGLLAQDFTSGYAEHFTVGIQRQLSSTLVLSADFVLRQFIHQNMGDIDFNRWNSVDGPVIRPCLPQEIIDPQALCSTGPIGVQVSGGRSRYVGLLAKLSRRWSEGLQFQASYALSSNKGFNGIIDNDDWFASYGPRERDRRHLLNVSGIVDLPWGLRSSFISTFSSKPPFRAQLFGLDLNGDGINNDLLPALDWNELNRGRDESDLIQLADSFNERLAGGTTPRGQRIPRINLPPRFEFGDSLYSLDLRLSKRFEIVEQWQLTLIGEVFNALNVANLSGYGVNLLQPQSFGQPSRRVNQVFGSGGPRAFQLGVRFSF